MSEMREEVLKQILEKVREEAVAKVRRLWRRCRRRL